MRSVSWRPLLATVLVLGLSALPGCIDPVDPEEECPVDWGCGTVSVWMERPQYLERYPIWTLTAVPRLIAFGSGDAETQARLDEGYVTAADGWPRGWGQQNRSADEWPASAERNWVTASGVWFKGLVPAGNYSLIRVEFHAIQGTDTQGRPIDVRAVGDRMSVAPTNGAFRVEPDGEHDFVLRGIIEAIAPRMYQIK